MKKLIPYKSLRNYTNAELMSYLRDNECTDLSMMSGLLSEILRRMNEIKPLLDEENQDWGNPLTL